MMLLISILAGCAILSAILAAWKYFGPEGLIDQTNRLKQRIFASDLFRYLENPDFQKTRHFSDVRTFRDFLIQQPFSEEIFLLLKRADLKISVSLFLLTCLVTGIFAFICLQVFMPKIFAFLCACAVAYLPYYYLKFRNRRYVTKFEEYLPNALAIISNSLKVGHGLEAAIAAVTETAPHPVSKEFETLRAEMKLGVPIQTAMQNLYQRIKSPELQVFVTGVVVHQDLGGNLSEILDHLEETTRERFALKREIKALSAQGVMSSWILFSMPLVAALIWFVTDPSILFDYAKSESGRFAIIASIVMQLVAFVWMRQIIALKD